MSIQFHVNLSEIADIGTFKVQVVKESETIDGQQCIAKQEINESTEKQLIIVTFEPTNCEMNLEGETVKLTGISDRLKADHSKEIDKLIAKHMAEIDAVKDEMKAEKDTALTNIQSQFEERLETFCSSQNSFISKAVKESVERLKQIKKIFSLYTVQQSMLEKIKMTLTVPSEEPPSDIEVALINARDHFKNIHEVYLDLLMKQQGQLERPASETSASCSQTKKFEPGMKAPDCVFYQRLVYSKDLLLKFVALDANHRFHKEVLSAFVDVFELDKRQQSAFFANLGQVK